MSRSEETEKDFAERRLFGRRKGRPLRVRKARLMEELLPRLRVALPQAGALSPRELFGRAVEGALLEIGFGGGEHLAAQAKAQPRAGFVGCEPFVNGVASLLDHLEREGIENVRVFDDDARLLLDALEEGCIETCFVLFADPWPKKRHAERRFIAKETLDKIARVLAPGGLLRLASDHAGLVDWMRGQCDAHAAFSNIYASEAPPPGWVPTRYEEKARVAGRAPFYLDYRRV